ncbi:hypothetical protein RJZ90_007963 [Blastomyces dermatitidis]
MRLNKATTSAYTLNHSNVRQSLTGTPSPIPLASSNCLYKSTDLIHIPIRREDFLRNNIAIPSLNTNRRINACTLNSQHTRGADKDKVRNIRRGRKGYTQRPLRTLREPQRSINGIKGPQVRRELGREALRLDNLLTGNHAHQRNEMNTRIQDEAALVPGLSAPGGLKVLVLRRHAGRDARVDMVQLTDRAASDDLASLEKPGVIAELLCDREHQVARRVGGFILGDQGAAGGYVLCNGLFGQDMFACCEAFADDGGQDEDGKQDDDCLDVWALEEFIEPVAGLLVGIYIDGSSGVV